MATVFQFLIPTAGWMGPKVCVQSQGIILVQNRFSNGEITAPYLASILKMIFRFNFQVASHIKSKFCIEHQAIRLVQNYPMVTPQYI